MNSFVHSLLHSLLPKKTAQHQGTDNCKTTPPTPAQTISAPVHLFQPANKRQQLHAPEEAANTYIYKCIYTCFKTYHAVIRSRSVIHSFMYSSNHSFSHPFQHSFFCVFIHSFIHSIPFCFCPFFSFISCWWWCSLPSRARKVRKKKVELCNPLASFYHQLSVQAQVFNLLWQKRSV